MSAGFAMSAEEVDEQLKEIFSDSRAETLEGVLAAGGRMTPELLIYAYDHGVFPWPHEGYPLLWFCPDDRGVIDFSELRIPRTFKKWLNKNEFKYEFTINQSFPEVIRYCRSLIRKGQKGSWINDEVEKNYIELSKTGHALSLEVRRDEKLVGGIYGVKSKKYFSCESMFHLEPNTSKLALYKLILHLQNSGHTWMDIQMVTEVSESFGGKYIPKTQFLDRIGC
jgi:leucyl/phenylalanyl-tRNA--protein transferase